MPFLIKYEFVINLYYVTDKNNLIIILQVKKFIIPLQKITEGQSEIRCAKSVHFGGFQSIEIIEIQCNTNKKEECARMLHETSKGVFSRECAFNF